VLQVEAMAQLGGLVMLPEDGPAGMLRNHKWGFLAMDKSSLVG
jgi:hypothetical protein